MNPWKALVIKHKAKSIKPIPEGWLTRAQVAEKIGCAESRVNDNLRSAIKAKDVLVDKFPIWDAIEGKVVTVQCYSLTAAKKKSEPTNAAPVSGSWPFPEGTRVRRRDGGAGVMLSEGRVQWDSGSITKPKGSSIRKIVPL
jgi:hypothetical protein